MPYHSTTLSVLVASPSELSDERKAAREALQEWNDLHAKAEGITLMPIMWETHAAPEAGDRPQGIINKQIVADADLIVVLFWTKVGTHTGTAESGTVEEMNQIMAAGKPALIYFSERPVPPGKIDPHELARLNDVKSKIYGQALVGSFTSPDHLRQVLQRDLLRHVRMIKAKNGPAQSGPTIAPTGLLAKREEEVWSAFERQVLAGQFHGFRADHSYMTFALIPPQFGGTVDLDKLSNVHEALPLSRHANNAVRRADHVRAVRVYQSDPAAAKVMEGVIALYGEGRIMAAHLIERMERYKGGEHTAVNYVGSERALVLNVPQYVQLLRSLGVAGTIRFRLALHLVNGCHLIAGRKAFFHGPFDLADQADISPPPVDIDGSIDGKDQQVVATILRPAFDWIWKQTGAKGCLYYDKVGKYDLNGE